MNALKSNGDRDGEKSEISAALKLISFNDISSLTAVCAGELPQHTVHAGNSFLPVAETDGAGVPLSHPRN